MSDRPDWLPADWRRLPDGTVQTLSHGVMPLADALILRDLLTSSSKKHNQRGTHGP